MVSMVNVKVNNGQYGKRKSGKSEMNNDQYDKYKSEQWPVW